MAEFKYTINTTIGTLTEENGWRFELNLVSWNGRKPVYDLRKWHYDDYDEVDKMSKGTTMTEAELKALYVILHNMYEGEE